MKNKIIKSFDELIKNDQGLITVVVQDFKTKTVLMVAYMNEEAYKLTLKTEIVHYYSRSRKTLWKKGETSGNYQQLVDMFYDCDCDTILIFVNQTGVACHTGRFSCFENYFVKDENNILKELEATIEERKTISKEKSYTKYLFDEGIDKILKKVGEESAEVIIGAKNNDKDEIIYEVSDLVYHIMVMLSFFNIRTSDIKKELFKRFTK